MDIKFLNICKNKQLWYEDYKDTQFQKRDNPITIILNASNFEISIPVPITYLHNCIYFYANMYKREIRTSITKKDKKLHNQHKNVLIKTVRTHG